MLQWNWKEHCNEYEISEHKIWIPNAYLHVSPSDEINCNDTNKNVTSFSHPFHKEAEVKRSTIVGN